MPAALTRTSTAGKRARTAPAIRATSAAGWRRAIGRSLLFTACLLGALAAPAALLITDPGEPLRDLHAYYDAGARLNAGEPLYDPAGDPDGTTFYRYPPLVAILFRPLALLPYELVRLLWAGLVAATFALTLRRVGAGAPGMRLVAALALAYVIRRTEHRGTLIAPVRKLAGIAVLVVGGFFYLLWVAAGILRAALPKSVELLILHPLLLCNIQFLHYQ